MHEIDAHSLKVLEFPRVREIVAGFTLSPYGKEYADNIRPMFDRQLIERALRESSQMRDIIRFEEAMPLQQIEDISEHIEKARVEGIHLEPKSLLIVRIFLDTVCDLCVYGKGEERPEKFPDVIEIIRRFHPKREISKAIGKAIDSAGEIQSSASSALARIRREIEAVGNADKASAGRMILSPSARVALLFPFFQAISDPIPESFTISRTVGQPCLLNRPRLFHLIINCVNGNKMNNWRLIVYCGN